MELPIGKGVFIYQIWNLEDSTVDDMNYDDIVNVILDAGISHVYMKIADGTYPYNVKWENYPWWSGKILDDFAVDLITALELEEIKVFGWHYVRGYRPLDEARMSIERAEELAIDGFAIDAEAEYKIGEKDAEAEIYMRALRAGLPDIPISLCSYRYPNAHPEFPYAPFLRKCDHITQQLYWQDAHNPVSQLDWSMEIYDELMHGIGIEPLPQTPVGAGYGVREWRSTPEDIKAFLQACVDRGLRSASLWSMDWMRNRAPELWTAFADFEWPDGEPEPPPPNLAEQIRDVANTLQEIADKMEA